MSVTNVYKTANVLKTCKVIKTHCGERANQNHAFDLVAATGMEALQEVQQACLHFVPLPLRNVSGKNNSYLFRNGVHLLQKRVIESSHIYSRAKVESVAA